MTISAIALEHLDSHQFATWLRW